MVRFAFAAVLALAILNNHAAFGQITPVQPTRELTMLEEVGNFPTERPTGIAVSLQGRVFVCFPNWDDKHGKSVAEVKSKAAAVYPDWTWNTWKPNDPATPPGERFVCVQSVWIDDQDALWILDAASPKMAGVVPGGAKLVKMNINTNTVEKVYHFDDTIAPPKSYLNDVRIDTKNKFAYISDSGLGAIIALNLDTGKARRLLEQHPSTKAESDVVLTMNGQGLTDTTTGKAPQIHVDGIALTADNRFLYYHALTATFLYRIPTDLLRDETKSPGEVIGGVNKVADTTPTDGMLVDDQGNVYHTAMEMDAIVRVTPRPAMETLAQDPRYIQWPDSMAFGPDNYLYFTNSHIHQMPRFNNGENKHTGPYKVYRFKLPTTGAKTR